METPPRPPSGDLTATPSAAVQARWQRMRERPYDFDLFHALRWLQAKHPQLPRLGYARKPGDEPVRLSQEPSLAFAPSALASVEDHRTRVPRITVYGFGLFGPNGPLPTHFTEYARDRLRNAEDPTLVRFLDIFQHRMLLLFFRAWADTQPMVGLDRPDTDRFTGYAASLAGVADATQRGRDAVPDHAKIYMAGHLSRQTRNAEGLASMLSDYFRVPVRIEERVPHWIALPPEERTRLGRNGQHQRLGVTAMAGARVLDAQHKFRIVLGPMDWDRYEAFLPGGPDFVRLRDWVRNYVGMELTWDVRLVLHRDAVRPARLGGGGRLGWSTWGCMARRSRHADELVLSPEARA